MPPPHPIPIPIPTPAKKEPRYRKLPKRDPNYDKINRKTLFLNKPRVGKWPDIDSASIPLNFFEHCDRKQSKHDFPWFGDFWKSHKRQNTSKMVIGGSSCPQTDPWWSTLPPPQKKKREIESGNLEISKLAKMRTGKSSTLVWLKSSQLE